jgi:uncharacterized protein YbcC (UPF0753/DUF2309 family)
MLNITENDVRKTAINPDQLKETKSLIEESLRISFPTWPLQNAVAVNPFWFLRDQTFEKTMRNVSSAVNTPLLMPVSFYQDLVATNQITPEALTEALQTTKVLWPDLPETIGELIQTAAVKKGDDPVYTRSFAEYWQYQRQWSPVVIADVGKYAAAYLDDSQALAPFPWKDLNFWSAWLEAHQLDQAMERSGIQGFRKFIHPLRTLDANEAIAYMLNGLGLVSPSEKSSYLKRLVASVLGWMSQFKYIEWQMGLGYSVERSTTPADLLAVRLAYDFALFKFAETKEHESTVAWRRGLGSGARADKGIESDPHFQSQYVLQLAWEISYQKQLSSKLQRKTPTKVSPAQAQMVFCIDVRSEMLRRQIEAQAQGSIRTVGFAGFFGLPFDFESLSEKHASHRLPVLLKPALKITESPQDVSSSLAASYFRNLRKNSLSSFAYVELFGALYVEKVARRAWLAALRFGKSEKPPERFSDDKPCPELNSAVNPDGTPFTESHQVARAAAVLRHMGLTSQFAPLVFIVGHGSETTNNALGSALDCGACGGHAGDINARILANLLNDAAVRRGLKSENIDIPDSTWFLPAVHETVTDEIHPLDSESAPASHRQKIADVMASVKAATTQTRIERQEARSDALDPETSRRVHNWSEVRPEWALAGNACFIVAPRYRTEGVNLSSRSFLHDYDWRKDATTGYQTLELIMTAPMVVTNWINIQYYASTVAPQVYGAGNKVLHNLVNEAGVLEGNGGDLRVGLALQSIHDGERFVHEPFRLSVLIEAPRDQIETIIRKHQVVRELVENEWLSCPGSFDSKIERI